MLQNINFMSCDKLIYRGLIKKNPEQLHVHRDRNEPNNLNFIKE